MEAQSKKGNTGATTEIYSEGPTRVFIEGNGGTVVQNSSFQNSGTNIYTPSK